MTTKRKQYEKPSVRVFELRQKPALLAGSSGGGTLQDYQWYTPGEE